MDTQGLDRRDFLAAAGATAWLLGSSAFAHAFPRREGEQLVPFTDPVAAPPKPGFNLQRWEDLDSWITPNDKFFRVSHYDEPQINATGWKLEVAGLVERPRTWTLADLKSRPRSEVTFTVECGGNTGLPWFVSAIGNARWTGTPLASILSEAGIRPGGIEVVFVGTDEGEEAVREVKMKQNFARSMSVEDAMSPANMLCYEMNGVPLPAPHGFPVRLIAPGWYGVANVKWLKRIEVRDTRFMGRFMARDYVTIREEPAGAGYVRDLGGARAAEVGARQGHAQGRRLSDLRRGVGPADRQGRGAHRRWPLARGHDRPDERRAVRVEDLDARLANPSPGEHRITSRATDAQGNVQPAMTDPVMANKKTYWETFGQVTRTVRVA